MQKPQIAYSRGFELHSISQPQQDTQVQTASRQIQNNTHKIASKKNVHCLGKLSYNNILYRKENKIVQQRLPYFQSQFDYKKFLSEQIERQAQVRNFCKERKKKDKQKQVGYYCLNNWVSDDKYSCQQSQNGSAYLAYLIFSFDFNKAQEHLQSLPKSLELSMLKTIISKSRILMNFIKTSETSIESGFLKRKEFKIQMTQQGNVVSVDQMQKYKYLNLFQNSSKQRYYDLKKEEKIAILHKNMVFLNDFANKIDKSQIQNQYFRLIFEFLGNKEDQKDKGLFYDTLLSFRYISLMDRLNFAQRLLTPQQKKQFIVNLESQLLKLPYLENMYFFQNKPNHIKTIFQNYLDEYGDLQTISYLAIGYRQPALVQYIKNYRQLLKLSFQSDQLGKLEQIANIKSQKNFNRSFNFNPFDNSFFSRIKIEQQKVDQIESNMLLKRRCVICYHNQSSQKYEYQPMEKHQRYQKNESFMNCAKCKHGGHLSHMLAWFQKHRNCPKIGCACLCN